MGIGMRANTSRTNRKWMWPFWFTPFVGPYDYHPVFFKSFGVLDGKKCLINMANDCLCMYYEPS